MKTTFTVTPNIDGYIVRSNDVTIVVSEKMEYDDVQIVDRAKCPQYANMYVQCTDRMTVSLLNDVIKYFVGNKQFSVTFKKEVL